MADERLTIGEVAVRTGVATSALRYWEEFGLLPEPARVSGQRRYPPSAVEQVGLILLLRDVGFTLREIKALVGARTSGSGGDWRELQRGKLAELDEQIARMRVARDAIAHGLACPHDNVFECPNFAGVLAARMAGASLEEAHKH